MKSTKKKQLTEDEIKEISSKSNKINNIFIEYFKEILQLKPIEYETFLNVFI
jgi:hypothetical protein